MPLLLLEEVRNLRQLQLVHPNRWHLFSLKSLDDRNDANRSPEDAGFKGRKDVYQSGDPEHEEDDCSLGEVL